MILSPEGSQGSLKDSALERLREFGASEGEVSVVSDLFEALPPELHGALNDLILFSRDLPGETRARRASKVARLAAFLAPHDKEFEAKVLGYLASPVTKENFFHARKHNRELLAQNALDVALESLRILSRVYNEGRPVKAGEEASAIREFELIFTAFLENRCSTVEQAAGFLDLTSPSVAGDLKLVLKAMPAVGLSALAEAAKKYKSPKEIVLSAAREELVSLDKRTSSEGKFAADLEDRIAALRSLISEVGSG
jgi:hypothetical protein